MDALSLESFFNFNADLRLSVAQVRPPRPLREAMQPDPLGPTAVLFSMMVCRVAIGAFSNRLTRTATSSSADEAIATPASSECDESVTIHADTIVVSASLDSSPSVKKEASVKKETQ